MIPVDLVKEINYMEKAKSNSTICCNCLRHQTGECDEFGLETLCGWAYRSINEI